MNSNKTLDIRFNKKRSYIVTILIGIMFSSLVIGCGNADLSLKKESATKI